jgi:hypothetical protein
MREDSSFPWLSSTDSGWLNSRYFVCFVYFVVKSA